MPPEARRCAASQQSEGPSPEATRRQAEKIVCWRLAVDLEPVVCLAYHLRLWNRQLSLAVWAINKLSAPRVTDARHMAAENWHWTRIDMALLRSFSF